ncbi:MAG TPA: type II toxin-antitoxin system RelE/ParE family toxin [Tepidisphaeraceae bacterium]|nr:type II toxin-antitoxin system RelE/ParE family toxin [Tepidisphaeraceae bacterium]
MVCANWRQTSFGQTAQGIQRRRSIGDCRESCARNLSRGLYRFSKAIYVLHVFQKKSKSGIKTPRHEIELIEARLKWAKSDYEQWLKETVNNEGEPGE